MTNQQTASLRRGPGRVDLVAVRERSCSRKHRHRTLAMALAERERVAGRIGPMVAYCCHFCAGWHLGHASRNPVYALLPEIMAEVASPPLAPTLACATA